VDVGSFAREKIRIQVIVVLVKMTAVITLKTNIYPRKVAKPRGTLPGLPEKKILKVT
jgi:hypothetical protein